MLFFWIIHTVTLGPARICLDIAKQRITASFESSLTLWLQSPEIVT